MASIRKPVVAGQFYPGNNKSLQQQLHDCYLDERGPGTLPQPDHKKPPIKAIIAPHAGYIYSGSIAAHAFHQLIQQGFADTFIILGPNHTGSGSGVSIMTQGQWQTPFGSIPINSTLAQEIHKGIIDVDENAHQYEHSIEVQLPFLQYLAPKQPYDFIPLCMMMQDVDTATEIGTILADGVKNSSRQVVFIASTDFSHVGFNYMSMPPENINVHDYATQQDQLAIQQILKLDPRGLIDTVNTHNISMCGYGPVAAVLTAVKKLGAIKASLLKYGTSYEVYPSTSCVGYGSFTII